MFLNKCKLQAIKPVSQAIKRLCISSSRNPTKFPK